MNDSGVASSQMSLLLACAFMFASWIIDMFHGRYSGLVNSIGTKSELVGQNRNDKLTGSSWWENPASCRGTRYDLGVS